MTKKEITKAINHIINSDIEKCNCTHCCKQLNGTYLDGLIASTR